jgi:hypothetical protein
MGVPPAWCLPQIVVEEQTVELPPWIERTITVTGQGAIDPDNPNMAQARLMAARAAELDAKRKLAEQIMGFQLTSDTTVRDFVTEYDEIETDLDTYIQGAAVKSTRYTDDGIAEVTVEFPLQTLWSLVRSYYRYESGPGGVSVESERVEITAPAQ